MKCVAAIFLLLISLTTSADEPSAMQQQLDAACKVERESKLAPKRERFINECVADWDKTREECTHFYRDYGDAQLRQGEVVRAPLYYDLPACQAAFENRRHYRQAE